MPLLELDLQRPAESRVIINHKDLHASVTLHIPERFFSKIPQAPPKVNGQLPANSMQEHCHALTLFP